MNYLSPRYVLSIGIYLVLPIAIFAPKGLAPLFALSILLILMSPERRQLKKLSIKYYSLILGTIVILAAISSIWSLTPEKSFITMLSLAVTFAGGICLIHVCTRLSASDRQTLRTAIIFGGIVGFGLLAIETSQNAAISQWLKSLVGYEIQTAANNRLSLNSASAIATLYFWPWSILIYNQFRDWKAYVGIIAACIVVLFSQSDAPTVALAAGISVFILSLLFSRCIVGILGTALVLSILLMPVLTEALPDPLSSNFKSSFFAPSWEPTIQGSSPFFNSLNHRFIIWKTVLQHVKQRPLFGHGFDTARALYGPESKSLMTLFPSRPDIILKIRSEPIPLHPHNSILQVWLEFGLAGAILLAALTTSILITINKRVQHQRERAICYALLISAVSIASVSFGAWQSWWLSGLFLIAGIAATSVTLRTTDSDQKLSYS